MPQSAIDQLTVDSTTTSRIGVEHLTQMAGDLFTAMLRMPFQPEPRVGECLDCPDIQATVRVSGQWNAEIHVIVSDQLARRIGCAMFGTEPEDLSDEEICDAMGEVANVIGGNAKGVVDSDSNLSLPVVGEPNVDWPEHALVATYLCDDCPLTVVTIES